MQRIVEIILDIVIREEGLDDLLHREGGIHVQPSQLSGPGLCPLWRPADSCTTIRIVSNRVGRCDVGHDEAVRIAEGCGVRGSQDDMDLIFDDQVSLSEGNMCQLDQEGRGFGFHPRLNRAGKLSRDRRGSMIATLEGAQGVYGSCRYVAGEEEEGRGSVRLVCPLVRVLCWLLAHQRRSRS